jgi:thiol-disulfide isomerase/thioredoxin
MKRAAPFLAVLCLLAVAVSLLPARSFARIGARPPSFTLDTVVGGPTRGRFRIDDHLGHDPVVILFWATWCGPCRQELPLYETLYERYRAQGLWVVAIAMDDTSTITGAGPAARRLNVQFPVLADLDTRVTSQMNPRRSAPFSVWVNKRGLVVRENEGFALGERDAIEHGIADLVAGRQ